MKTNDQAVWCVERVRARVCPGSSLAIRFWGLVAAIGSLVGIIGGAAHADSRKFTYVYEVTTMPKGQAEYEQWTTWKTHKQSDKAFDRFDFRHEIEFGITDRLQLAIYLADWRYEDGKSVANDRARYQDTAVEVIYQLTDPVVDPLGLALYGEIQLGDEKIALEGKIIAQKDLGSWTIGYNATIEAEWEGENFGEDKGVFEQTVGASYQINPNWSIGAELLHEVEFDDWQETGDHVVYVGPNLAYRAKGWWTTVTPLFQVTSEDSEADFQTRLLFGVDF